MNMLRVIIFDLDGVLIDSRDSVIRLYELLFEKFLLPKPKISDIVKNEGMGSSNIILSLLPPKKRKDEAFLKELKEYIGIVGASNEILDLMKKNEDVLEFLKWLRERKYRTAIATNRGKSTAKILRDFNFMEYFNVVVTAVDCEKFKPEPEMLLKILQALNVKPEEAIFIGDNEVDEEAGKRAGIKTFIYPKDSIHYVRQFVEKFGGKSDDA